MTNKVPSNAQRADPFWFVNLQMVLCGEHLILLCYANDVIEIYIYLFESVTYRFI